MKFATCPGTATDTTGGTGTTIDQSTSADFSKQGARIDGHALVSDDWGHAGDQVDDVSDSKNHVPLEDLLGDEKMTVERDHLPGLAV